MLKLTGKGSITTCDGVTRRDFLQVGTLGALGLTLSKFAGVPTPMTTPPTRRSALAAAAGRDRDIAARKLVIVVCRGGMDGLSVSPPVGDPDYANLRGRIAIAPF